MDFKLIAKYLAEEVTEDEKNNLESWINEDISNKKEFDSLCNLWEVSDIILHSLDDKLEKAYNKVEAKIAQQNDSRKIRPFRKVGFASAAAIIMFLISFTFIYVKNNTETHKTGNNKKTVKLYDNSVIVLNKNSVLKFRSILGNRNSSLTGEAFFDIEHNEKNPFVVKTEKSSITVLGTSFYVTAYNPNEKMEVKVSSGKVSVEGRINGGTEQLVLDKGQRVEVDYKAQKMQKFDRFDENSVAWNTGEIKFKAVPLTKVILTLEEVYGIEIKINIADKDKYLYTGIFDQTPLKDIINTLAETFDMDVKEHLDENLVIFY